MLNLRLSRALKMTTIRVPYNFKPRSYQIPVYNALSKGFKRVSIVWFRRAGKDKTCVSVVAKEMFKRVGSYYYVFPSYTQGKKILWDGRDASGFRTLEHIPREAWIKDNSSELSITLKNNSRLQIIGSENVDALVGTNPVGIVFSEWSLQDPAVWDYLSPILEENDGWAIFNFTPRGDSHSKLFHEIAKNSPDWFTSEMKVTDTDLFTSEKLERIRREYIARHGDDYLFQQEYMISFDTPIQGAVYGNQLQLAESQGRITTIEHDGMRMVDTVWDLGVRDTTAIIFFQKIKNRINIIDYYETSGAGMGHFVEVLRKKGYSYGLHYLPHDAQNRQQGLENRAESRVDMLKKLGITNIKIVPRGSVEAGIEKARAIFSRCYFSKDRCERLITCLREYAYTWDDRNKIWSRIPKHDWTSHGSDSFRYLSLVAGEEKTVDRLGYRTETVVLK